MQVDLLLTLIDILGFKTTHASSGMSLFQKNSDLAFATHYSGNFLFWLQGNSLTSFIDFKPNATYDIAKDWKTAHNLIKEIDLTDVMTNAQSYVQVLQNAIFYNKLIR